MNTNPNFFLLSLKNSISLWVKLLKIMVPISLAVKIAEQYGLITYLGNQLEPVMIFVGLPGILGLVWAVAMMTNLWAGALLFVSLSASLHVTTGQATILGILMLMAHGLPIELRVVQKIGVSFIFSLAIRVLSAIFLAFTFNQLFLALDIYQGPATILLTKAGSSDGGGWFSWVMAEFKSYFFVLAMLTILVTTLDYLKRNQSIQKIEFIFSPFLSFIGVSKKCAPITLVGMALGLVYGSALLVKETEESDIDTDDVTLTVTSLNLFHSIIEDTIIVVMMGAGLFWVLVLRLVFTAVVMRLISKCLRSGNQLVFRMMRA
jgi:hypothetical protein